MDKIKIQLLRIERHNCREVWVTETKEGCSDEASLFFGRDTYGDHTWYSLGMTGSHSERGSALPDDYDLVLCDKDWKEMFHDGNGHRNNRFASLEELCREGWEEVKHRFPKITRDGFDEWILSKTTEEPDTTAQTNRTGMWHKDVYRQIVHKFTFLRQDYAIYRVTRRHTKCDAYWYEYFAGRADKESWKDWSTWYGTEFSDELSDMLRKRDNVRYVVDPYDFTGTVLTSMADGVHSDYGGETLEELRCRKNNGCLEVVTAAELDTMLTRWEDYLQGPFREITEEQYWDWLEVLPPMRYRNNSFFVSECYSGTLYRFCFKRENRYFTAMRSKRLKNSELDAQITEFMKELESKESQYPILCVN